MKYSKFSSISNSYIFAFKLILNKGLNEKLEISNTVIKVSPKNNLELLLALGLFIIVFLTGFKKLYLFCFSYII